LRDAKNKAEHLARFEQWKLKNEAIKTFDQLVQSAHWYDCDFRKLENDEPRIEPCRICFGKDCLGKAKCKVLCDGIILGFGEELMRREPALDKIRYNVPKNKDPHTGTNGYTKFYRYEDSYDGVPNRMTYETFPEGFWYSLAHLLWLMNKEFLYFTNPCYTVVVYRALIGKGPRKFKRACREEQTA
jgi:hypothetical protein